MAPGQARQEASCLGRHTPHDVRILQNIMKTTFNLPGNPGLAIAVTAALGFGLLLNAADEHLWMKGAEHLQHLRSPAQAQQLKKGDTVAMVCAKCKNVAVTRVERERGREFVRPGSKHACAGCSSEIEVVGVEGHGLDKQNHGTVKHVCKSCGDDSAFCCATKRGAGATKGMEKK